MAEAQTQQNSRQTSNTTGANGKNGRLRIKKTVATEEYGARLRAMLGTPYNPAEKPIWETAIELASQIPDEERANVPKDFARNYKHYLHGHPIDE